MARMATDDFLWLVSHENADLMRRVIDGMIICFLFYAWGRREDADSTSRDDAIVAGISYCDDELAGLETAGRYDVPEPSYVGSRSDRDHLLYAVRPNDDDRGRGDARDEAR